MKTILFVLTLLVSFVSFSQQLKQTFTIDTNLTEEEKLKYSGMELQSYAKQFNNGVKMIGVGQALVWSGVYIMMNSSVQTQIQPPPNPVECINCVQEPIQYVTEVNYGKKTLGGVMTAVGGILSVIGTVHIIDAPKHIKNAGLILSGNGVGIVVKL
jgi:hypothetical protein